MINWETTKRVHFIGIGGVGISALARLTLARGKEVSGTEDNESPETLDALRAQGVVVSQNLNPGELPPADCYIYSDAWLTKHPQVLEEARKRTTSVFSYFQALGEIANHKKVIAISGTHGKTTTTAMLADVLEAAGLDPDSVVGSLRAKTKSNFHAGSGEFFVVEADEYRRHFLEFTPYIVVITNIDADHLDYYRDMADIQSAFRALVEKVPKDGFVVCDPKSPTLAPVVVGLSCKVIDYTTYYDPTLPLKVLSLHRMNAAAVLAVAGILQIDVAVARKALAEFSGVWRRFEYKGVTEHGAMVYDDYGHHPTEVQTTLESIAEQFVGKRIVVAFHPHLYSRTKLLMKEFSEAFDVADEIVLAPIFAAREIPDKTVSSEILAQKLREKGKSAQAFASLEQVTAYLRTNTKEGDLVVTMGAGDIYKVAEALTKH